MSFMARYSGPCENDCGRRIEPGDLIRGAGESHTDGYVHAVCPLEAELTPTRPPCLRCFTVPAANGACLCDD